MRLFVVSLICLFVGINGQTRVPLLLWSSKEVFGTQTVTTTNYETVSFLDLWNSILSHLVVTPREGAPQNGLFPVVEDKPDILVLFMSKKLTWMHLGQNSPTVKPLHDAFDSSDAQFAFTNVVLKEGQKLSQFIPASLNAVTIVEYFGGCSENGNTENLKNDFERALWQGVNTKPRVLLICGSGSLDDEMSQLEQVNSALTTKPSSYTVLLVSDQKNPIVETIAVQKRRSLLQTEEKLPIDYDTCDKLCMTRVKFLEGIVLSLILALALTAGLCCMNILDSPTQFEKPEEEQ